MDQLGLSLPLKAHLRVFVAVGLFALAWNVRPAAAQAQIFVTNHNTNTITVYPRSANGNVAAAYSIVGQQGDGPHQVAINNIANELIVTNFLSSSVVVYNRTTGVLKRMIAGPETGLNGPVGVDVDEVNGEIFVSNFYGDSITVYSVLATGNALPIRTIRSGDLSGPVGLTVDPTNNEIVVAVQGFHSIATFDRVSDGPSVPKRLIKGDPTGLFLPMGVALDFLHDEILVANSNFITPNSGSILAFGRLATGDASPTRMLEGSATKLCNPISVAVDVAADELVVSNSNAAAGSCAQSVTTYARSASGNAAPKRTIAGTLTSLNLPLSAAITSASGMTVKSKATDANVNAGATVSYTVTATATGGPVFNVVMTDALPAGLAWSITSGDTSLCTLSAAPASVLTCSTAGLAKGGSVIAQVSAVTTSSNCPAIIDGGATVSFNDGTANVTAVSLPTKISVKCR